MAEYYDFTRVGEGACVVYFRKPGSLEGYTSRWIIPGTLEL